MFEMVSGMFLLGFFVIFITSLISAFLLSHFVI